jgi:hypothetical protein
MTITDTATGTQTPRALHRTDLAVSTVPLRLDIDDPSIRVDDGNLYISNFTETDAAVVRVTWLPQLAGCLVCVST